MRREGNKESKEEEIAPSIGYKGELWRYKYVKICRWNKDICTLRKTESSERVMGEDIYNTSDYKTTNKFIRLLN